MGKVEKKRYSWVEEVGKDGVIPPEWVFYEEEGLDGRVVNPLGDKQWQKLYLFATRCSTVDVADRQTKRFPIWWKYLQELLYHLLYETDVVVFKVRQILMTWSLAVLDLWEAMAVPHSQIAFISLKHDASKEFLGHRIVQLYKHLPENWREAVRIKRRVHSECEFSNGSRIFAFPSSSVGGRSLTLSRAQIDEAGYIRDVFGLRASLRPALGDRGKLAIGSTPQLVESDFEAIVREAEEGNGAKLLTFPVGCKEGRDKAWQEKMRLQLGDAAWETEFGLKFALKEAHALIPTFNEKVHVRDERFINDMYGRDMFDAHGGDASKCPVYSAYDPHVTRHTAGLWMMVLPDEKWYFFDELWLRLRATNIQDNLPHLAKTIRAKESGLRVVRREIDPYANMSHRLGGMLSVSHQLREQGIQVYTAKRHSMGFDTLQARFDISAAGETEAYVHPRCKKFIRALASASVKTEEKAKGKTGYDHLDCAKYIANCRPTFRQADYEPADKRENEAYNELQRELVENMESIQRGGRVWTSTTF